MQKNDINQLFDSVPGHKQFYDHYLITKFSNLFAGKGDLTFYCSKYDVFVSFLVYSDRFDVCIKTPFFSLVVPACAVSLKPADDIRCPKILISCESVYIQLDIDESVYDRMLNHD